MHGCHVIRLFVLDWCYSLNDCRYVIRLFVLDWCYLLNDCRPGTPCALSGLIGTFFYLFHLLFCGFLIHLLMCGFLIGSLALCITRCMILTPCPYDPIAGPMYYPLCALFLCE